MKNILKGLGLTALYGATFGAAVEAGQKIAYRIGIKRELRKASKLLDEIKKNRENE